MLAVAVATLLAPLALGAARADAPATPAWYRVPTVPPGLSTREWRALPTDAAPTCDGDGPVLVLVHGFGGDGREWPDGLVQWQANPGGLHGARVWLYRWSPFDVGETTLDGLVAGVDTLAACGPLTLVGHSAGGIVASLVVDRLHAVHPIRIVSVASPLAGTGRGDPKERPGASFAAHLGERIDTYPQPAPGVSVWHARSGPRDRYNKPRRGHAANDPAVGVPGATRVDLPAELGHSEAVVWTMGHLDEVLAK